MMNEAKFQYITREFVLMQTIPAGFLARYSAPCLLAASVNLRDVCSCICFVRICAFFVVERLSRGMTNAVVDSREESHVPSCLISISISVFAMLCISKMHHERCGRGMRKCSEAFGRLLRTDFNESSVQKPKGV